MNRPVSLCGASLAFAAFILGQSPQRQAVIRGGGNPDQGKCTVEVLVDGAAEVQVQGTSAAIRTTSGQPAQWRRFECTSAMPANPANFHFSGVDGRGRQELIRDPRNGGAAVVGIVDSDNGAEAYTFDLTWGGYQGSQQGSIQPGNQRQPGYQGQGGYREYSDDRYRKNYRDSDYYRRYGHGFATERQTFAARKSCAKLRAVFAPRTSTSAEWISTMGREETIGCSVAWTSIGARAGTGITSPVR